MQMTKKLAAATLLLALLCFTTVATALAQTEPATVHPGVSQGDTFTYSVKGAWSSTDPNATMAENIREMNMTDYFRVEVTSVTDSSVSIHTVWRFTNGTQVEGNESVDVQTGMHQGNFWGIFAGNLNVEDRIHPMGIDQLTVNASQTKTYSNVQREINMFISIGQFESTDNSSRTFSDYMTVQFDKQTGMLVNLQDQQIYTNPAYTQTIAWELTDTNAFTESTAGGFPVTTIAVVAAVVTVAAVLVAVVALKSRGKKHPPSRR
jgi:hypothetical protein